MSESSPFVLAPVAPTPADPRLLTLHLDICRMKAELELLETRISRIRASEVEAAADTRPFVDRAQDLLDRTVTSLYESGRAEIEAIDRQSRLDAEARLCEASRQAQLLLAAARDELADALTERADAVEPGHIAQADVVILPDEGLLVLPGDELIVLPDPGHVILPGDDAVVAVDGGLTVIPGDDVSAEDVPGDAPVIPSDELVVVPGDDVLLLQPEDDASSPATAAEPAALLDGAAEPFEADPPATAGSLNLPGLGGSWSATDLSRTPPATGASETTRADAAFDVWLAMAPPVAPTDEAQASETPHEGKGRPGWLRPLEAVAALVLIAVFVALGLVLVG